MSVIRATVIDGDTDAVRLDPVTHALLVIDSDHQAVHQGVHFAYMSAQELSNAEVLSFTLTAPDTLLVPHFLINVNCESETQVDIYADASPDDAGTVVSNPSVINRDQNSANVNTMLVKASPVVGDGSKGTLIASFHVGSGRGGQGEIRGEAELLLKRNTIYWIDITNHTATDNYVSWVMDWYEHQNRDNPS